MTKETTQFSEGNWIVHRNYGVGQIQGTEVKSISGEKGTYYKIEMSNSVIWVPEEKMDGEWFRPLATPEEFEQALEILQKPPRKMASNFNKRKSRIKKVRSKNSPTALARILRDLWGRRRKRSLSNTEQSALRRLTDRFLAEWSVCMGLEDEEARQRLHQLLSDQKPQPTATD